VNAWKVIGYAGTALFAARWIIQSIQARRLRRSVVTPAFWLVTLTGSSLLMIYFTLSPYADPVGWLGNALPFMTASYNLLLVWRAQRSEEANPPGQAFESQSSAVGGCHEG
jgi:lipid-A-disaccharide synthase-like uncharacterized protein